MRGDPAEAFVRSWRRKIFVYEIAVLVPVVLALFLVAPRLLVLLFLSASLVVVCAGERWFARAMRSASRFTWSDAPPSLPLARFPGIGLSLLPNQPSGYREASLGTPFVWRHEDDTVLAVERDVVTDHGVVLAELFFVSFLDPARAILITYGDARPMMLQTRRFFLQATGRPMDCREAVARHVDALRRLVRAGLRARRVDCSQASSMLDEFDVVPPSLTGGAGLTPKRVARRRAAQLARPVWEQPDYRRRLEHCLAAAPDRLPRSP